MVTNNGSELLHITPPFSGTEATAEKASRISVLYVDETPNILDIVCRYLERSGEMMVDTSFSIEDAINKMRYISYDVIVTDYNFEDGSANTLLKYTREKGDRIPFVYFALFRMEDLEEEAMRYGGVTFTGKSALYSRSPFSDLEQAIKKMALAYHEEVDITGEDPVHMAQRESSS